MRRACSTDKRKKAPVSLIWPGCPAGLPGTKKPQLASCRWGLGRANLSPQRLIIGVSIHPHRRGGNPVHPNDSRVAVVPVFRPAVDHPAGVIDDVCIAPALRRADGTVPDALGGQEL